MSLEESAVKLFVELARLTEAMESINDLGSVRGFCDQHSSMESRIRWELQTACRDTASLRRRIEQFKAEESASEENGDDR